MIQLLLKTLPLLLKERLDAVGGNLKNNKVIKQCKKKKKGTPLEVFHSNFIQLTFLKK